MRVSRDTIAALLARVDFVELVERSVELKKAGGVYKGRCVFHSERTASMLVYPDHLHCLAGETLVMTDLGRCPIASLAGASIRVLTRGGGWVKAKFDSYGKQQLWDIELSRNGLKKTLRATKEHRWFVRGVGGAVTTEALRVGHRLESVSPLRRTLSMDRAGVQHGIIFGDGSVSDRRAVVNLHGTKDDDLAHWFDDCSSKPKVRDGDKPYRSVYIGRPQERAKSLPDYSDTDEYLYGFLAGYMATDGHVAKDGTVMLNCAKRDVLERVRDIATGLGIVTFGVTEQRRKGYGTEDSSIYRIHFAASSLSVGFFLREQQRARHSAATKRFERLRWVVESVSQTDAVEDVFCADVPLTHCFALDDNILTGNCFGCGAHVNAIGWLMERGGLKFPEAIEALAKGAAFDLGAPVVPKDTRQEERRAARQQKLRIEAAIKASAILSQCDRQKHPYLYRKGFREMLGLVMTDDYVVDGGYVLAAKGDLIVPMRDFERYGYVTSLQRISPDPNLKDNKKYLPNGQTKGSVFRIADGKTTFLCEGYATGLSIQAAMQSMHQPGGVICTFSADNMKHIATLVKRPAFIFCDNDESGVGEAAAKVTGLPYCIAHRPEGVKKVDANDLFMSQGIRAVATLMREAMDKAAGYA